MLVLSRKMGQWTVIAGSIRVVVLGVRGDRVKLGFEGPAHVPIHREEVFAQIERQSDRTDSVRHLSDCLSPSRTSIAPQEEPRS